MSEILKIEERLTESAKKVEAELCRRLSPTDSDYDILIKSMSYSTLGGGKRIRPFLVMEFCRLFSGEERAALPFACAVEMVHCFSLIHDDMPCMDDDALRRGRPTNHIVFGEDIALLAGDALSILAYETVASNEFVSYENRVKASFELARASGRHGMVGGQVMDMLGEKKQYDIDTLKKLHSLKTGAIIRAAALLGCYAAGATEQQMHDAACYADGLGLAFQIIDDILDKEGDAALLGKATGSDEKSSKTTYLSFMTTEQAREAAKEVTKNACGCILGYEGSGILCDFAEYMLCRNK